jgi:hypothetical protein
MMSFGFPPLLEVMLAAQPFSVFENAETISTVLASA